MGKITSTKKKIGGKDVTVYHDQNGRSCTKDGKYYSRAQIGFFTNKNNKQMVYVNGWYYSKSMGSLFLEGFQTEKDKTYTGNKNQQDHVMMHMEVFYEKTGVTRVEYVDVCTSNGGTFTFNKPGLFINCATYPKGSITRKVK